MNENNTGNPLNKEPYNNTGNNSIRFNYGPINGIGSNSVCFNCDGKIISGCTSTAINNTTTIYTLNNDYLFGEKILKDVIVKTETIEIIYTQRRNYAYTIHINSNDFNNDRVIKEIYGVKDGKLSLIKTINGIVVPPREIPEMYEFDE